MRRILAALILAVATASALWAEDKPSSAGPMGRWEKLPLVAGGEGGIGSMGVDPGGTIWIAYNRTVYHWAGGEFRQPEGEALVSGMYLAALFGGSDRGLYLTQPGAPGDKAHLGKLYKLSGGRATPVADFYYDDPGEALVYVSKSGRVFNWGRRFLAALKPDGTWDRAEMRLHAQPVILDAGATVYFYYAGKVHAVDAEGKFTETGLAPEAFPYDPESPPWQFGALLGDDTMILATCDRRGVAAFHLPDLKPALADALRPLRQMTVEDVFRGAGGSVWLVMSRPGGGERKFACILPTGEVRDIPPEQSAEFHWTRARSWQRRAAVMGAGDGALWLGPERGGPARWKDGSVVSFGWEQGLAMESCDWFGELPGGRIVAASFQSVWVYDPKLPRAAPPEQALWQEFPGGGLMRDSAGNAWTFRADRPGRVSRREGAGWVDIATDAKPLEFGGHWMADDRAHLLIFGPTCADVGPEGATDFAADERKMIQSAVARGTKRFDPGTMMAGCVVLEGGRIWFAHRHASEAHCFDGKEWDRVGVDENLDALCESPRWGAIFRGRDTLWRYDRGQFVKVDEPEGDKRRLLGPGFLQPFEEELLRLRPDVYTPVEQEAAALYALRRKPTGGWERGEALPNHLDRFVRASGGGAWGWVGSVPHRILGSWSAPVEIAGTPLAGRFLWNILDDRDGNVWFETSGPDGKPSVFRRSGGVRMRIKPVPAEVGAGYGVVAESESPGVDTASLRLLYRLPGCDWKGGDPGGSVLVEFAADGEYDVEFVAMDPLGAVSKPARVHMRSKSVRAPVDP